MTRIDFYTETADRVEFACRLVQKALQGQHRVVIYCSDEAALARTDRMLWTTPPTGFLPHCMAGDPLAPETPVVLCRGEVPPDCDDVLVNLDDAWPPDFARFRRLAEIVSVDEADRDRARARYRFYRDRGYEIATHAMGNAARG